MRYAVSVLLIFFYNQCHCQLKFYQNESPVSIEERMQNQNTAGISIATFKNFSLDTTMVFGYLDKENQITVNKESLFQAGAISNSFTHYLILLMEQEGKIDISEPVNNYLKEWKLPATGFTRNDPVTVQDLILQTRGFKTVSKPTGFRPGDKIPSTIELLKGKSKPLNGPVTIKKTKNKSGNSSYLNSLILQHLVESIYGRPFQEVMHEKVITPLNLSHTFCASELSPDQQKNASVGYDKSGKRIEGDRWIYPELAAAGIWTTPQDLGKYALHLFKAFQGKDNSVLEQAQIIKGLTIENADYRRMLLLHNVGFYWGGASMGFRTQFSGDLEKGNIVVVFMNSHENWQFMHEVFSETWNYLNNKIDQ